MEGAYVSNLLIERSKIRLQRLPYIERVDVDNTPVAGSPDLVDVDFDIEYRMPGQFSGGVGFSESQKLLLNGSIVHTNFLGTGNRVALEVNTGRFSKLYSIAHTDPYRTMDGIRRTVSLNFSDITQFTSAASDFSTTTVGASLDYGYPISEYQSLSLGVTFQHAELLASTASTQQAQDWVANNGNPFIENIGIGSTFFGTKFNTYELVGGWSYDSRNRSLFATRGLRQQLFLSVTAPGSEVEFATARYSFTKYFNVMNKLLFRVNAEIGYGQALGETTALPPYKQYFGCSKGSTAKRASRFRTPTRSSCCRLRKTWTPRSYFGSR